MPSTSTWWWIGIGAGTAAVASVGGFLIYRGRKPEPVARPPDDERLGGAPPPTPMPPPEPAVTGFAQRDPYEANRAALCRKWKQEEGAPRMTPIVFEIMNQAVDEQIAKIDPRWSTQAELDLEIFLVARGAIGSVCPDVPLPDTEESLADLQDRPWWAFLWRQFSSSAYSKLYVYKQ